MITFTAENWVFMAYAVLTAFLRGVPLPCREQIAERHHEQQQRKREKVQDSLNYRIFWLYLLQPVENLHHVYRCCELKCWQLQ